MLQPYRQARETVSGRLLAWRAGCAARWAAATTAWLLDQIVIAVGLNNGGDVERRRQAIRSEAAILTSVLHNGHRNGFAPGTATTATRCLRDRLDRNHTLECRCAFKGCNRFDRGRRFGCLRGTRNAIFPFVALATRTTFAALLARCIGLALITALAALSVAIRPATPAIVIALAYATLFGCAVLGCGILIAILLMATILVIGAIAIRTPVLAIAVLAIPVLLAVAVLAAARLVAPLLVSARLLLSALAFILIIGLVFIERRALDAAGRWRAAIFLEARASLGQHAEVMIGKLQIIFDVDAVTLHLRIARERLIFLEQLGGIAARTIVDAIAGILTTRIATRRALLLPATTATAAGLTIIDQVLVVLCLETNPAVLQ
jgi:hypothetical protein